MIHHGALYILRIWFINSEYLPSLVDGEEKAGEKASENMYEIHVVF